MIDTYRRRLVMLLVCVGVLTPPVLAAGMWPSWWEWIAKEQTPMTWLQSVTLVVAALLATGCVVVRRVAGLTPRRGLMVLAVGFAALALDERFAVHERVRDRILAPRDITIPLLPWVGPGDFLILLVALAGLAALPVVWRAVAPDAAARRALVLAVGLAVVAVAMDSVDPATLDLGTERLAQTAEECVELLSGLAFTAAMGLRLLGLLGDLVAVERGEAQVEHHELATTLD